MRIFKTLLIGLLLLAPLVAFAQQEPQYSQYMYNTQVINPGYAGNQDMLSFGLLYRTQWVGIEGAPKSATFTVNSPINAMRNMALGFSVIHDEIGPSVQTDVAVDYSYSIPLSYDVDLSFGIKGGFDVLDIDFTKLNIFNPSDPLFAENIDNRFQPKFGAGVYLNSEKYYVGLSIPNMLKTKHYDRNFRDDIEQSLGYEAVAASRFHYYLIAGYVFDLNRDVKFKPATMLKMVKGAPLQWDVSANFMFNNKFILGASWRWDAALSAMAGFNVSPGIMVGVAYDYQLTDLEKYSDGSYEIFLKFDIFNKIEKVLTPRFF